MPPRSKVLKSGLTLITVPVKSAASVCVGVFVKSGSRNESDAVAGISHLIEHMLFKGTKKRTSLDITLAVEGKGGSMNAYTSEDTTCYYMHLPEGCLREALDILFDMYRNAAIAKKEFIQEREVVLEEIKMYADEPDSVAMENLQKLLFEGHPLGRPVAGSAKSLLPLTPKDLKNWIKEHYLPEKTTVVVVGKFAENEIFLR